jgi:hypothetical protein
MGHGTSPGRTRYLEYAMWKHERGIRSSIVVRRNEMPGYINTCCKHNDNAAGDFTLILKPSAFSPKISIVHYAFLQ